LNLIKRSNGMVLKRVPGAKVKKVKWRQVKHYYKWFFDLL
jgi:hypothetical protein